MTTEYTPGPWKFGKELTSHAGEWLISIDAGRNRGNPIAETRTATGDESANARLIAAAPDMLELLELIIWRSEQSDSTEDAPAMDWALIGSAKEVIAKATGETP